MTLRVIPDRGIYTPGELVRLVVELGGASASVVRLRILHLATEVASLELPVSGERLVGSWQPPAEAPRGYGVEAQLLDEAGRVVAEGSSAFDVLQRWTDFPRYGFATEFAPERTDLGSAVEALLPFHLNALQFYDWQYRHDHLMAPSVEYLDPLGRRLSLDTVRQLIEEAHRRGMATLAYLAVYGASAEFWRAHPDWALYDAGGAPIPFGEDFLGLLDPSPGSPWSEHLRAECRQVLSALPFDGLHLDQYGEPREAFNARGEKVDLPEAFRAFIAALKEEHPRAPVTLNAVANWPIEVLASSRQDFAYIELWPDTPTYREVGEVVAGARRLSGGKPVVIALYLPARRVANIRLADALIYAAGGSRLELGEGCRLLADPYFPKHQSVSAGLASILGRYADLAVRYGELIGPFAGDVPVEAEAPDGVWVVPRSSPGWLTVSLINMTGLGEARWDEDHPPPLPLHNVAIRLELAEDVRAVWWASPDGGPAGLEPLGWRMEGGRLVTAVPSLEYWSLLAVELDSQEP